MTTLRHDLRVAGRRLGKSPAFTLVAALTTALGIGASTAIFSVVYGVLLRPIGIGDPAGVAVLSAHRISDPGDGMGFWPAHLAELRAEVIGRGGIRRLASYVFDSVTLLGDGEPTELGTALMVDGDFFPLFEVEPIAGRALGPQDVIPRRRGDVCVISETLWRSHFGADPHLIGRSLVLDQRPVTVVGVMPATVPLPQVGVQLWMPQGWDVEDRRLFGRLNVLARLEPGAPVAGAEAVLATAAEGLTARHPRFAGYTISARSFARTLVGGARPAILAVAGAVGLILLIACANVANLLLSRAVGREREIATRRALGARHRQLAAQLLTESLLLALMGGVLGTGLAVGLHRLVLRLADDLIPRLYDVRLDWPVLGFAAAASVIIGLIFGLAPALYALSRDLSGAMRGNSQRGRMGLGFARRLLVVAQVAVAVVLVAAAALFLRSLVAIEAVDPGFRTAGIGGARIFLDDKAYGDDARELAYFESVLERLRSMPGISHAGATSGLPMDALTIDFDLPFTLPGEPAGDTLRQAHFRSISPGYLETLGIPLLRGRPLDATDRADAEPVALINATFARIGWGERDPVGETFSIYGGRRQLRVVGVVGDVRFHGKSRPTRPAFFVPFTQTTYGAMAVVARAEDGAGAAAAVASAAAAVDPQQPVHSRFVLADVVLGSLATHRFYTRLLLAFAAISLLLAGAGIYGVLSYWVSESRRELGVRLAIGASSRSILGLVLGRGLATVAVGLLIGLAAVAAGAPLVQPFLYAIHGTDALALGAVVLMLALIAVCASLVPALRAARLDPASFLRLE